VGEFVDMIQLFLTSTLVPSVYDSGSMPRILLQLYNANMLDIEMEKVYHTEMFWQFGQKIFHVIEFNTYRYFSLGFQDRRIQYGYFEQTIMIIVEQHQHDGPC
jgi:hypothetical protein